MIFVRENLKLKLINHIIMKIVIQDYKKFVEIAHEQKTTTRELGTQIIEEWLKNQK